MYNSLDMAARLWLMFGFGSQDCNFVWDGDKTLLQAVMAILGPSSPQQCRYIVKLGNADYQTNPLHDPSVAVETMPKLLGIIDKVEVEDQGGHDTRAFPGNFSLRQMSRLVSFHIEWTDDIFQHLIVKLSQDNDYSVYIFHHATVLREMWLFSSDV